MVVVKKEVRDYIVGVARRIFTWIGFRKTTMDELAAACHKGKSSIYYYFQSKEEIFRAVVEKEAEELQERLDRTLRKDDLAIDRLKAYILFRLHRVRSLENFYAALNEDDLSHMDFILKIRRSFDMEERRLVSEMLEDGMQNGSFQISSSEIGAIAISTMMKGLELPLLLSDEHKSDREELLEDLIRVLFYGIIKR